MNHPIQFFDFDFKSPQYIARAPAFQVLGQVFSLMVFPFDSLSGLATIKISGFVAGVRGISQIAHICVQEISLDQNDAVDLIRKGFDWQVGVGSRIFYLRLRKPALQCADNQATLT